MSPAEHGEIITKLESLDSEYGNIDYRYGAPQADRLRIIRTDETPLEVRFSDGDIKWIDDDAEQ